MGLTDGYSEAEWRYVGSGGSFDVSTSAFSWWDSGDGADYNCAVTDGKLIYDTYCDKYPFYGLCELETDLC